jgi:predicted dehydrogenase
MVQQLAPLGKPIVVEKPLAIWEEAAIETVEVVRRYRTPVAVGHQYRYQSWARAMVEILDSGRIGDVYAVNLEHSYFNTSGQNYPWLRQHERYLSSSVNCHYFDLLRFLLRDEIDRVYAYVGQSPDRRARPGEMTGDTQSIAILHARKGAVVNLFTHEDTRGGTPAWPLRLTLSGTRGSLFYEYRPGIGPHLEVYDDASGSREVVADEIDPPPANLLLVQDFLRAVREKREPPTDAGDHLNTLAVGFACYESGATGNVARVRHHGTPRYA